MTTGMLIGVIDDDESVRESLPDLLRELGFTVQAFTSAEEFLASDCVDEAHCLVLDIGMPGMSGLDLQTTLQCRKHFVPIIFITAQSDETLRPRLLARGAIECLLKPFSDTALVGALRIALQTN